MMWVFANAGFWNDSAALTRQAGVSQVIKLSFLERINDVIKESHFTIVFLDGERVSIVHLGLSKNHRPLECQTQISSQRSLRR